MLTKSNLTPVDWNHILRSFNLMSFSMFSCSHFGSILSPKTMSERQMQEEKTWRRGTGGSEFETIDEFSV